VNHCCSRAVAAVIAAVVGTSSPVHAREPEPTQTDIDRARELYDNGRRLYEEGSYGGAIVAFERAYELSADNNLLYNISLAYDRLESFEQALAFLDRYRALAPADEQDALERRKQSLLVRLEKQREDRARDASAPAPEPPASPPAVAPTGVDAPAPRRARVVPPVAWAMLGVAGSGLAVGTGFGAASLVRTRAGEDGCVDTGSGLTCSAAARDDARKSRRFAIAADVSFAIGAAAAIAFVTLVGVAVARHRKGKRDAALAPAPMGVLARF
jgi:tetratricopeptide (TPR) repeat protein